MSENRITICCPLLGDSLGGSHVSLKGLLDQLPADKYRILIVCDKANGVVSRFFEGYEQIIDAAAPAGKFKQDRKFGLLRALRVLPALPRYVRILREEGVDIVHTNDGQSHAAWSLAAKLAGKTLLWHHRSDPEVRGIRLVAPLLADKIVAVSNFALPVRRWGALRDASVIHSPFEVDRVVDRPTMRAKLVEELGCDEDAILCGYFGLFIDRKRPQAFIDAVLECNRISQRPVIGLLFGEAPDDRMMADLEARIARDAADGQVRLMGYRSPGLDWIAACDLLLVPAVGEPLGRTLVEAMLVETPVIAARSGGNPEALDPNYGILVPPGDAKAMARAAIDLMTDDPRRSAMIRDAKQTSITRFSSERHVSQVEAVYAELVK